MNLQLELSGRTSIFWAVGCDSISKEEKQWIGPAALGT
jgi:hypothetical protein